MEEAGRMRVGCESVCSCEGLSPGQWMRRGGVAEEGGDGRRGSEDTEKYEAAGMAMRGI